MKLDRYELTAGRELLKYEFISMVAKGNIKKQIQSTLLNKRNVYNLAFGDIDSVTGEIDDLIISNNGDSPKVLATVVYAVSVFLEENPNAWVYAKGSTDARTRLYKSGISKYIDEIKSTFEIYGRQGDSWQFFEHNQEYTAFLARLKSSTFDV